MTFAVATAGAGLGGICWRFRRRSIDDIFRQATRFLDFFDSSQPFPAGVEHIARAEAECAEHEQDGAQHRTFMAVGANVRNWAKADVQLSTFECHRVIAWERLRLQELGSKLVC